MDWIAGAVGVVGIVSTGLTARGGRKHAEKLAGEDRNQARLAEAYIELLGTVNRASHWAQEVRPVYETNPPRELPPLPPVEEQLRAETLIMAYGSKDVRRLFEGWRQTVWAIIRTDQEIRFAQEMRRQGGTPGVDVAAAYMRLNDELRPAQVAARDELAETVAAELRPRDTDGRPWSTWWGPRLAAHAGCGLGPDRRTTAAGVGRLPHTVTAPMDADSHGRAGSSAAFGAP